jgi:ATP-dependent Clp protease ATP-binding subunit ClpA
MLSRNLEQTLRQALAQANARRHEYATLEHLLLSLTEDQDAVAVMRACGVDIDKLRRDVTEYIDAELANLAVTRADRRLPARPSACRHPCPVFRP